MNREYFFKNQSSLQRKAFAGSLAAAFAFSAIGSGFVGAMDERLVVNGKLFELDGNNDPQLRLNLQNNPAKKLVLIGLVIGVLVIVVVVVILVLTFRSKGTQKSSSKETTEPDKGENGKEQKGVEKQEVEQSSSKILDGAEIAGRTLTGGGIGLATASFLGEDSKDSSTTIADGGKVEGSGESGVVKAVTPQGDVIPGGMQGDVKDVETMGKEGLGPKNTSESIGLEANYFEKVEGKNEITSGTLDVDGNVGGLQNSSNVGNVEEGNVKPEGTVNEADHKLANINPDGESSENKDVQKDGE